MKRRNAYPILRPHDSQRSHVGVETHEQVATVAGFGPDKDQSQRRLARPKLRQKE
jgi:hypothetical protein